MNIKVDSRETGLIEKMNDYIGMLPIYKNLNIIATPLPLGDIIFEKDGSEKLIIERKTIRDLGASIKDGRYEEQSYRLNGVDVPNHNILYLIEGDINKINKFVDKTDKITIFSAIFSLNYYKGFSVIRTMNIEETALFICNCAYKMQKNEKENKLPYYSPLLEKVEKEGFAPLFPKVEGFDPLFPKVEKVEVEGFDPLFPKVEKVENFDPLFPKVEVDSYVSVVKRVKKENITPQNIDEIMLCQIPGISDVTASAILSDYKTIFNLVKQIKENGTDALKNITYKTSKDQTRKINKTCIENIQKFLS
jgi:ERCC4-type nuclease